jgi:crotonobetainyl-CoA:carnitine CoA-transferase CaiB-like acyl-CoA transferase
MNVGGEHTAPLSGIRVVEFCNVAAGPFCAMLLADMGADVVKAESKSGDTLRQWPPFSEGFSENFASLNRNKRSIALDLKDPADNAVARELISRADVVVENNRPGAMSRLGLGYEAFAEDRPDLIYCSLSACGQSGPLAGAGGFDLTIQAMSGIMSVTGEADGPPVKCGVPISDFSTGLYGAFAIASLVARVRAGGRGGHIDVSMLGASLAVSALQVSEYFGSGKDPRRLGDAHPRNAPYQAFRASDGEFAMAAGNDKLWEAVCRIVGRLDLFRDPKYLTTIDRARNQHELAGILNAYFATRTVADLTAEIEAAGVPCSPINSYSQALANPQVAHMGWVQPIDLPGGATTRTFGPAIAIDGQSFPIRSAPPALDGDRDSILAELRGVAAAA